MTQSTEQRTSLIDAEWDSVPPAVPVSSVAPESLVLRRVSASPAEPTAPARPIPALLHVLGVVAASIVFVATATSVSADRNLAAAGHQVEGELADDVASMPVHTVAASPLAKPAIASAPPLVAGGAPDSDSALDVRVRAADPSTAAPPPTTKHVRAASGARARAKSWNRKLPPSDNPF
ncbi:MAG TPA: hypothetical protein VLJ38_14855 [Polyangiaceae bacterium]|nr:hypothetical protein [Polyangiaceae bacterium]